MNKPEILNGLIAMGMSTAGACAMAGNMEAESGLKADIAQRGMTGLTDAQYTAAADSGSIDFVRDSVGYGLCQWTFYTRKAALIAFAKAKGASVGDGAMQLEFCVEELKSDYAELWEYLCTTEKIYEAASRICREYERPAVNNIDVRAKYAQEMYDKYGAELAGGNDPSTASGSPPLAGEADPSTASGPPPLSGEVTDGRSPEAVYLAAMLDKIGYDVLWEGIKACIIDFQLKTGLKADGICGKETWEKLMEVVH